MDEYVNRYGRRLYGLCLALCKNKRQADDLYQDVWLKAFENFDKYDRSLEFEPWLTKICVNTYRNLLRRLVKRRLLASDEEPQNISAPVKADYTDLHNAINRLPDKYRLTIILFYFRDMNIKSVADTLAIPEGTVKSRLSKAKRLLKEVLTDEYDL